MIVTGLIGDPISHSLSPRLHHYWLRKYNIDAVYVPLAVTCNNLEDSMKLLPQMGIRNFNVTSPHKESIIQYLDEIDQLASRIGAVNIVYQNAQQKLIGSNSDGYGFIKTVGLDVFFQKKITILGAGGAARAIIAEIFDQAEQINIVSRNIVKADKIISKYSKNIKYVDWLNRYVIFAETDILINTVPNLEPNIDLTNLKPKAIVIDSVYNPLETNFLLAAKSLGMRPMNGFGLWMLIYQASKAFELWFGIMPEIDQKLYDYLISGN